MKTKLMMIALMLCVLSSPLMANEITFVTVTAWVEGSRYYVVTEGLKSYPLLEEKPSHLTPENWLIKKGVRSKRVLLWKKSSYKETTFTFVAR